MTTTTTGKPSKTSTRSEHGKLKAKERSSTKQKLLKILSEEDLLEETNEFNFLRACCCPKGGKKSAADQKTILLWRNKYCRSFDEFLTITSNTTRNARLSIPGFNDLKHQLSYEDDPTASGLSSLGTLMWILTYGIQHLVDPAKNDMETNKKLSKTITELRVIYQEIGSMAQKFVLQTERFSTKMAEIHGIIKDVVKRLCRKYKFTRDPLQLRPEYKPRTIRVRKRVGYGPGGGEHVEGHGDGGNSSGGKDEQPEDEDELFHINWSPLTVILQYPSSNEWEIFGSIPIDEKLRLFKLFLQYAHDTLEGWMQKFKISTCYTELEDSGSGSKADSAGAIPNSNTTLPTMSNRSPLFEIANAMQNFVRNYSRKSDHGRVSVESNNKGPHEQLEKVQEIIQDFWFTMDSLYQLTYELERLVQETRDIIRTCYVYSTNFYQWKMTSYDTFDPKTKTKEYRENQKQMKAFMAKVLGQRRFSDAAMFISLADFTSSIYQKVGQEHEITIPEGHSIRLSCWQDEEVETWGLVGDVTVGKGTARVSTIKKPSV